MSELTFADFYWQTWDDFFGSPADDAWTPQPIGFPDEARRTHAVFYGGTGVGKSRLIEWLMTGDVIKLLQGWSDRGVGLIDVNGDIDHSMRARLATVAKEFPELEQRLYIIDPMNENWTVRYNPLQLAPGELPEDRAEMLTDVVTTIFQDDPRVVTRLRWVLYHTFLALILADRTLLDFSRFLRDRAFRGDLVYELSHPGLEEYWFKEFPQADRDAMTWAESSLDRVGPLVTHPRTAAMFNGPSTVNFRHIMDSGGVLLVNAPIGKLGTGRAYLLCAFILAEIFQAAMSRVDVPEHRRRPFVLFCDEFHNYACDTINHILREGRKFKLELVLATQQVAGNIRNEALQSSVRKLCGNVFTFRLDAEDAALVVRDVFTPALDQVKYTDEKGKPTFRGMDEIWQREIRSITATPNRMLWWKRRGHSQTHYVQVGTVTDIDKLPHCEQLPAALKRQDFMAYKLAGVPKAPVSGHAARRDDGRATRAQFYEVVDPAEL